jgi:hypothetical protein
LDWFIKGLGCLVWGCKKKGRSLTPDAQPDQETLREQFVEAFLEQAKTEGDQDPVEAWKAFSKDIRKRLKKAA